MHFAPQGSSSCGHSQLYSIRDWKPICGLCLITEGFQSELPGRIHLHGTLAENGNPESDPRFIAHLETVLGLVPPQPGQSLRSFRLARAQYKVSPGQYPVTSALHIGMGLQPPIVLPVVRMIERFNEYDIAVELDTSVLNIQNRIGKGVRFIMRLVRDAAKQSTNDSRGSERSGAGRFQQPCSQP